MSCGRCGKELLKKSTGLFARRIIKLNMNIRSARSDKRRIKHALVVRGHEDYRAFLRGCAVERVQQTTKGDAIVGVFGLLPASKSRINIFEQDETARLRICQKKKKIFFSWGGGGLSRPINTSS